MSRTPDPVFVAFCDAGLWPGLGTTLAAELTSHDIFGPEDVTAANLVALPRVGGVRAGRLLSSFIGASDVYDTASLLVPAGLAARLAGRAVDVFGPGAARLLRDDPWRLLQLPGVDVPDADAFARAVLPGVSSEDPRRSRALVAHALARAALEGHTVATVEWVYTDLELYRVQDHAAAIEAACTEGLVSTERIDGVEVLALDRYHDAETEIAESIVRLDRSAKQIGKARLAKRRRAGIDGEPDEHGLDEVQRSAVDNALRHGVSVLTGGPGTGKSRTVAALVTEVERAGKTVALAAPTGRAAKRLAELCETEAFTLHRLLGAQPRTSGEDGKVNFSAGFTRGADLPLDQDVVVVDEASMLDVELAAALLRACKDGTHVLFVGDAAQLPSIGPGQVLADLIDSGVVPVVELDRLYRQDAGGAIARLATAVRGGSLPEVDSPDREVVIVPARGSADCAHRVVQLVTDSIPRALGISPDQIQVVTPVHRGPAGTIELNVALKAKLNPGRGGRKSSVRFDVGDRVVATANHPEAQPVSFANGEVGTVIDVVDKTVTIDFGGGKADVTGKALGDILHGWAITVHRAQGSEFAAVVVVLPPEGGRMMSRPLVYTALTRAQRHLSIVHGTGPALVRAVREVGATPRRTLLRVLLQRHNA